MQPNFLAILSTFLLVTYSAVSTGAQDQVPLVNTISTPSTIFTNGSDFNTPTRVVKPKPKPSASRQPKPFFEKNYKCKCYGKEYTHGNLYALIFQGALATPIPRRARRNPKAPGVQPHLFLDSNDKFEGQWKNSLCSNQGDKRGKNPKTNLVEYPANSDKKSDGYKFDRVVYTIWDINDLQDEPKFCGCMTHKAQPKNQFVMCDIEG